MINQWLQHVNHHDLDKVVSLYADDATLWGTFSPTRRDGTYPIRDYFEHFLGMASLRVKVTQITTRIQGNTKVYSGQYTFRYQQENAPVRVRGRFTFVTHTADHTEKIVEHHSSVIPELKSKSLPKRS